MRLVNEIGHTDGLSAWLVFELFLLRTLGFQICAVFGTTLLEPDALICEAYIKGGMMPHMFLWLSDTGASTSMKDHIHECIGVAGPN